MWGEFGIMADNDKSSISESFDVPSSSADSISAKKSKKLSFWTNLGTMPGYKT